MADSDSDFVLSISPHDYTKNLNKLNYDRQRFIAKVYTILTTQLAYTFILTEIFVSNESIKNYVQGNTAMLVTAIIIPIIMILGLLCFYDTVKTTPCDYIYLTIFTIFEGYVVAISASYYDASSVMLAILITLIITVVLTIYAWQTKVDYTIFGGFLLMGLTSLLVFGILLAIFCSSDTGTCAVLNILYASIGAFIMAAYIIVDTQMIMDGSHQQHFDDDEYVLASINLYLDVIQLFLKILYLISRVKGEKK
jgi:FtsH-binding integral membrane protein